MSVATLPDLPDILEAQGLTPEDEPLFLELRSVVERYDGALDALVVTLLHKHFDLKPGEVLVQTQQGRVFITRPMDSSSLSDQSPINWRFSSEGQRIVCTVGAINVPRAWHLFNNDQLSQELAAVLERYGALNRFGFGFQEEELELGPNERMLETWDPDARILVSQPSPRNQSGEVTTIETAWHLRSRQILMGCDSSACSFNRCHKLTAPML